MKDVDSIVASLKRLGTKKTRDGMSRYAIPSDNAFGVPMAAMQKFAKNLGRNHDLALALWDTGFYEARIVAAFVDEPERERNFVKKGVSWALRGIGRRNRELRAAALAVAKRLADSADAAARWVGKDALRDLGRSSAT